MFMAQSLMYAGTLTWGVRCTPRTYSNLTIGLKSHACAGPAGSFTKCISAGNVQLDQLSMHLNWPLAQRRRRRVKEHNSVASSGPFACRLVTAMQHAAGFIWDARTEWSELDIDGLLMDDILMDIDLKPRKACISHGRTHGRD